MIFIDTGAFIARYLAKDEHHHAALTTWDTLIGKHRLLTSHHVIDETITLLARKAHTAFAVEKAHILYQTEVFKILRTDLDDEIAALQLFEKYGDHNLSFTDCLSVSLIRRHHIQKVFSYDEHFRLFGLEVIG